MTGLNLALHTEQRPVSVDEFLLPMYAQGRYAREPRTPYGPTEPIWLALTVRKTGVFRAYRYAVGCPDFAGKDLRPQN